MSDRFGKYIVESEIGKGGFGRVYCAFDTDMQRRVAIKEVISEGDPDLLARFQAEASTTAKLKHDNIVTVYEYGQQNGRPYLVMEFLEGRTLEEIIRAGNDFPLLEKVEILYQIAEGLQHAHSHGVIHRDVKPGNVMVFGEHKVKIMDFGIARLLNSSSARRTKEGYLVGSALYMAPESFSRSESDKRTDIFAYGIVAYEFLTGSHPFPAKDVYSAMHRIAHEEAVPLRERVAGCPYPLELLVQRLMMKDREARYEDLSDVLFDTEPILRQLRRERALSLAREAERLFEAGQFEVLLPCVKQILRLDPANSQALFWQDKIRERMNRRRAEKLRQQGVDHMSASRFQDAVGCFEGALHLDPNESGTTALLENAQAAVKRVKRAAELLTRAYSEKGNGSFEKALASAAEASDVDPANGEACQLRDSLRRQIREMQTAARLAECYDLRRQNRHEEALAILDGLEADLQRRSDVAAARMQIQEQIKQVESQKRHAAFVRELDSGRQLLEDLQLDRAVQIAGGLCSKFPEESDASLFRKEVDALSTKLRRAQTSITEGKFESALELVRESGREFGKLAGLQELEGNLLDKIQQKTYKRELDNVLNNGRQRLDEGRSSEAVDLLETAAFKYKQEPSFQSLLETARAAAEEKARIEAEERSRRERERAILAGYRGVSDLSRAGRLTAAFTALDQVVQQYGESAATQALRKELESARLARLQQQTVSEILAREADEFRKKDYRAALRILEEGIRRYPDNADLLKEQQRVLDRLPRVKNTVTREEAIASAIRKAATCQREGDFEAAVSTLETVLRRYPNSSEIREHLQHASAKLAQQRESGSGSGTFSWLNRFVNRERK